MFEYINRFYQTIGELENHEIHDRVKLSRHRRVYTSKIVRRLIEQEGLKSILEIGPASGYITYSLHELKKEFPHIELDVLDVSTSYLDSQYQFHDSINNKYEADISDPSFIHEKKYDLIIFQEVLEHLVSPFIALTNINTCLNDGKHLLITIPNASWFVYFLRTFYYTQIKKKVKRSSFLSAHIAEISVIGIFKLLTMAGFNIESSAYFGSSLPLIKYFLSAQVGILAEKAVHPEISWDELTKKHIKKMQKHQ